MNSNRYHKSNTYLHRSHLKSHYFRIINAQSQVPKPSSQSFKSLTRRPFEEEKRNMIKVENKRIVGKLL